jgi:CheY-like chemotaxis protein
VVLVVDDDDAIRECVAEALAFEGFGVVEARNGRVALDLLDREHPDVILLDLMMPVMNGWEFREEQKRRPTVAAIPVIVVTATMNPNIEADRVLTKPLSLDTLLATVHQFVASSA